VERARRAARGRRADQATVRAAARALVAACFLAPVVVGLLYSEFILAFWVAGWIGLPLAILLDFALRAPGERRWWRSVLAGSALAASVFFACLFWYFVGYGRVGIAAGIGAGALAAALLARLRGCGDPAEVLRSTRC
jgi:hypothetical protein